MEDLFKIHGIVNLKKGEGRTLKAGGMWVYDNEIASTMGEIVDGGLVEVHDFDGYFMGIGYINRRSKITVRMMSRRTRRLTGHLLNSACAPVWIIENIRWICLPAV